MGLDLIGDQIKEIDSQLSEPMAGLSEEASGALQQQRERLLAQRNAIAGQYGLLGAPDQPTQQPGAASTEGDDELRSMMYQRGPAATQSKAAPAGQAAAAPGAGLQMAEPEEEGKRYQLGLADTLLPKTVRETLGAAPGKLATNMNAESLFRKTFNRSPSDDEMAALLEMGMGQDGRWVAPHWRDLRERFGGGR